MSYRPLLPSLLTLSALGLAACGEDTTQPNSAAEPSPGAPEFALVSNTWRTRADMWGVERSSYAAVNTTNALGQTIVYVIGGRSLAGNPLGNVMAYNVYTNTWTVKAPLPVPLYATNGVGVINGNLYISGGCRFPSCTRNGYSPALYMYDPTTNAWTRKSDMPDIGGYGGVTGVLGGKLYVLTTCIDVLDPAYYECEMLRTDSTGSRLAVYDPATDRWTRRRQADATYNMGAFIGGKFYVARGVRALPSVVYPGGLAVYDPATNRWTRKAPPPGVMGSAAVEMRGKLYVVGASVRYHADETSDTVRTTRVYDPATNTWSTKAPIPWPRFGVVARRVYLNGQALIEVVGGSRPGNNLQYAP